MNKKIIISILISTALVVGIGSSIIYNKENNSQQYKTILNKTTSSSVKLHENKDKSNIQVKKIINPHDIIVENNNPTHSSNVLIGNTVEKWISSTQFNYAKFNAKETKLTEAQIKKLKDNHLMLFYMFIYANGVDATHKNITAQELNKTAIAVKEQLTGKKLPIAR